MSLNCSVCGIDCSTCLFLGKSCTGCDIVAGKTFWADELDGICPIYNCAANIEKLKSCAQCELLPCELYLSVKDPSVDIEEHKAMILKRINNLKNNYKIK